MLYVHGGYIDHSGEWGGRAGGWGEWDELCMCLKGWTLEGMKPESGDEEAGENRQMMRGVVRDGVWDQAGARKRKGIWPWHA